MKLLPLFALAAISASPVYSETSRQMDAHEHGVGQLDIAFDGQHIAMELHAPGADIVGFEHAATSAEDRAAVDAAVGTLARPLQLFVVPEGAGCSVVQASAELESEEEHDAHEDDHSDTHSDEHKDEHNHDDHQHDEHAKGDDDHDDHAMDAGHTEFHAEYLLTCAKPTAVTEIKFAYFDAFPNALEVEVQIVSDSGAASFEVKRDAPMLDLGGIF